ncbi:anti-phage dCTP deaminase [Plesiomonas shigelloides]|uniref:anti-phage dCTP deaminase n=1 Tax=Plesiomonas shigelloides TaxID=703 RepID=UPI00387F271E
MSGLDQIFKERRKFIIIGLTGRTGSGCTTVSELLSQNSFSGFNPPKPKSSLFDNDEERKYRVVYEYLKNQWVKFYHIKMSDIVSTFILELDFDEFNSLYMSILKESHSEISSEFNSRLKECYDEYHIERIKVKSYIENNPDDLHQDFVYDFYFKKIQEFSTKLKRMLNKFEAGSYTKLYQITGNNIRKSGHANNKNYNSSKIYLFAQRANTLIKILRKKSKHDGTNVCVVLDAIRNPYESFFFKERYSAFYLWSISTPNETRVKRLLAQPNISNNDIDEIDLRENPKSLKGEDVFWSLDVKRCVEISDIHIFNPDDQNKLKELKKQIVKYLALIMHPGIITPSQDERCMHIAYNAKLNSGCISRQVGAVVTDADFAIKSVGWNNVPQGQTPCNLRRVEDLICHEDEKAFSSYEKDDNKFFTQITKIYEDKTDSPKMFSGKPISYCFKDIQNSLDGEKNQVHTRALHAEENAFLQISKYGGISLKGGTLYTTASPCELCAKKAYQLGIRNIIYIDPYPGISAQHIIDCGTTPPKLIHFSGAIGRAYLQLFEPIIPYKDELEIGLRLEIPNTKKLLINENNELKEQNQNLEAKLRELEKRLSDNTDNL